VIPFRSNRRFRWLPWLALILVVATWYAETTLERLEMAGTDLVREGDFEQGPPGGPEWDIAAPAAGLWQPEGGIEGGGALRLQDNAVLRYRLDQAHRSDGYFVGVCLRQEGTTDGDTSAGALVHARKAGMPVLATTSVRIERPSEGAGWHCGLASMAMPFGLDELVVELGPGAQDGYLWVDRLAVYPAVSPPLYDLVHVLLVVAWLVLGAFSVVAVWYALGAWAGAGVVLPALALLVGLFWGETWLSGLVSTTAADVFFQTVGALLDSFLEALRVFTADRSWRATGVPEGLAVYALALLGVLTALMVHWRYRWTERPWSRVFLCAVVFGLSVQALRILLHRPDWATLHWIADPLSLLMGLMAGAVAMELLWRIRLRLAG